MPGLQRRIVELVLAGWTFDGDCTFTEPKDQKGISISGK